MPELIDKDEEEIGAHHCTRENVSYTISFLRRVESGEEDPSNQDWPTQCGVLALQMEWLLSNFDN